MANFTKKLFAPAVLIAAVLFGNTVSAQDYYTNQRGNSLDEKNFRLGLSVNPNIGWYRYNDDSYESSSKMGFSYGLLADLGFAKNYYFSTGLLINSISSKATYPADATKSGPRDLIRLQYVDIPLTVKLKSEENELGRFYGQFGFTTGFKVSGKEKFEGSTKKEDIDGDDLFRLGLQLGGGAEWRLSDNLSLLTGLSFNNGFTRAIKDGKPKTSFVALNVGVFF
ncbi:PorT family protein [Sphingobacterium sp. SGG-5]|uniref:porin family protein n=1 Tax=Sphingobacterium sp. SGG-5 TaxID=2710881 RepID=UPI0013EAADA6|nr:porin family protein [Sphingobacterium sp. SGG-5]NGM60596.1 PorT family protein [Sphingobacterium sp. SGG-5]